MTTRLFAAAISLAALAATPALATDLTGAPADVTDWSGVYIGGTVGYVNADVDTSNILFEGDPSGIDPFSTTATGWLAGVTLGGNMQMDNIVVGVEGDYSVASAEGSHTDDDANFTSTARLQSLGTLRGRLGFAAGNMLLYGTGGLAFGHVEGQLDDVYNNGIITSKAGADYYGWTAGAGAEVAMSDTMSIKGEALYYDLGSENLAFDEGSEGWEPTSSDNAVTGWIARVGLNFKMP